MQLLEHHGKHLLAGAGLAVPEGEVVTSAAAAAEVAQRLGGRVVVKAQVPAGHRGQAGAVRFAASPAEAETIARELLGTSVGGSSVDALLVERAADVARELYAAVLDDASTKGPLVLFSTEGGMDVEEVSATAPERLHRAPVDIRTGLAEDVALELVQRCGLGDAADRAVADALVGMYALYRDADAALVEVNPLALTADGAVVALDAKVSLDPAALPRQRDLLDDLPGGPPPDEGTELERQARSLSLNYIELDGEVGVLANGAGLTMTTLDAVHHYGGRPADFLEIGGDAYTKATPALRLVLSDPKVKSLLVNFCGAFARTDVMTEGVVAALEELRPEIPAFFTVHGTGEAEAVAMIRERLGAEPYDRMDDAVRAAVAAAGEVQR